MADRVLIHAVVVPASVITQFWIEFSLAKRKERPVFPPYRDGQSHVRVTQGGG
jgi:hypothetical protein